MNNYDHFGVMLDCSRNAVMRPQQVMKFIDCLEKMGYNTLELYTEDTLKIEGEPYCGYMRGAYSADEIKAIDAYARLKGIELIPCIQTLAHFTNLVKLPQYRDIVDIQDILLIDEPRTYEFIENIFKTISENFTSRRVNIGMDEAHMVGLGSYLRKHGLENRFELLARHLKKVLAIAEKYGFQAHMWSDMFFRLANNGNYYAHNKIDQSIIELVPDGVEFVYWDYYQSNKSDYDKLIELHRDFGNKLWFAGGVWTWRGFAPCNQFSLHTMRPAIESVREYGIRDVLMTMWGDNGGECSFYSVLPSLYTIRQYADGNFDEKSIKDGFKELFGLDYDSFMLLDAPNALARPCGEMNNENPCRTALYSDCFLGHKDLAVAKYPDVDYGKKASELKKAGRSAGEYAYIFDAMSSLCSVMDIKKDLGILTRKYYASGDKESLAALVARYDLCIKRLKVFYKSFKTLWFKENKTFGWEVQDVRLGGLICRLQTCRDVLKAYADGELDSIDELEETLLPVNNSFVQWYKEVISYCEL